MRPTATVQDTSLSSRFAGIGRAVRTIFWIGAVSLALTGCSKQITDRSVDRLNTEQASVFHRSARSTIFVDARPADQFAAGHIPGAVNRRLGEVSSSAMDPDLARYRRIVVYGDNPGSAAAIALAKRLFEAGHSEVVFYEPGFEAWKAAGLPVEKSS